MYRLGIIEESLDCKDILIDLKQYLINQRIEEVPEDTIPIWHTNEYHVPDFKLPHFLPVLEKQVLPAWYIHAFNDDELIVVLKDKSFTVSREKDDSWNDMIAYGESVNVERRYLENIPLHI